MADLLTDMRIEHEFVRPASPEQNAHIESFHSVMRRPMVRKHQFDMLDELKEVLARFRQFYNHERP
ncbi:MAG TPA: integrase core domain-containing protein, partial [Bacteroidia bacterium]|nr:integrase core domain-containing protein [Bacteroidia bacterium]